MEDINMTLITPYEYGVVCEVLINKKIKIA